MDSKIKIILSVFLFFLTITINAQDKKVMKIAKYIEKGKGTEAKELLDELDSKKEYLSDIYYWYVRTIYYRNAALANTNSPSELAEARKSFEKLVEFDKNDQSKSFSQYIPQIKKDLYEGKNQMTKSGSSSQSGAVNQANDGKSVTLTQIGQGKTKEAAKYSALRSALEKAFGTFISSNTTIFNDELVKDEIVSVSSGNIQNFEILSETQMPNGSYTSIVKATVSIGSLTKFCESKGIAVEFKGGLFAANIKILELNQRNERYVISNLINVIDEILSKSFDFTIDVTEPIKYHNNWSVKLVVHSKSNNNFNNLKPIIKNVIDNISLDYDQIASLKSKNIEIYSIKIDNKIYYFRDFTTTYKLKTMFEIRIPFFATKFTITNGLKNYTFTDVNANRIDFKKVKPTVPINWPNLSPFSGNGNKYSYGGSDTSVLSYYPLACGLNDEGLDVLKSIERFHFKTSNFLNDLKNSFNLSEMYYTIKSSDASSNFQYFLDIIPIGQMQKESIYSSGKDADDNLNDIEFIFGFENILSIENLSKVTEYKVQPIIK
jgi:hypothetical protein